MRDSYHTGLKYGVFDHSRLINTLALGIDPESNEVLDDYAMWDRFRRSREDPHCSAIMDRYHVREVYSTSEVPSPKDEAELQAKKMLLEQARVDF